jgi:hypothetical protein
MDLIGETRVLHIRILTLQQNGGVQIQEAKPMRIQADPHQTFESQKVEFLHEKFTCKYTCRLKVKKHTYEGTSTKAFLKGRKPVLYL